MKRRRIEEKGQGRKERKEERKREGMVYPDAVVYPRLG